MESKQHNSFRESVLPFDDDFWARIEQGDFSRFDELLNQIIPNLISVAKSRFRLHDHEIDELIQVTCIKLFEKIRSLEHRTKVFEWARSILYHTFLDLYRTRQRRREVSPTSSYESEETSLLDSVADVGEQNPFDKTVRLETSQQIQAALRELPDIQRQVILEYYFGDKSLKEIAVITKRGVGTLKSDLQRARGSLQEILSKIIDLDELASRRLPRNQAGTDDSGHVKERRSAIK